MRGSAATAKRSSKSSARSGLSSRSLPFRTGWRSKGSGGAFLYAQHYYVRVRLLKKMAQDRATDDLSPRGAGRNRTDESRFCRPLPYHLATAPGYTGLELTSSEAVGEPSACAATLRVQSGELRASEARGVGVLLSA